MRHLRHILTWFVPLAIAVVVGLLQQRTERSLLPEFMHCSYTYGDDQQGGRSHTRIEMRDGILFAVLDLEPQHPTPFTGFGFGLTDAKHPQGIDFTPYDHLEIEMRSPRMHNVGFNLITWIPGFTNPDKPLTAMYQEGATVVTPVFEVVKIPFSVFAPGAWWPEAAGIGANTAPVRMDLVKDFEIRAAMGIAPPRHDTLEVRSIKVAGTNRLPLVLSILVALTLSTSLTLLGRHRLRSIQVASLDPVAPASRLHVPVLDSEAARVELPNRRDLELQALLNWIHAHYHDETLGVEDASRGTGVSIRKIPQLLKEHSGKSFPAFIAALRIAEACRLLRETDRQVSEIALAVGFSNSSHFHRVFKAETGESPSAWREKAGAPEAPPET